MKLWLLTGGPAICLVTVGVVVAGIPLPDTVLYGRVFIDRQLQHPNDDITVTARVDGVAEPVGQCRLGDRQAAGDNYILHIRLESLADGSIQARNAALVGQTVHLFVQKGAGPEEHFRDYLVSDQGHVESVDLGVRLLGDWDGDGVLALADHLQFVECMEGPAVVATDPCITAFDFNDDSHVDLVDAGAFQAAFGAQ